MSLDLDRTVNDASALRSVRKGTESKREPHREI